MKIETTDIIDIDEIQRKETKVPAGNPTPVKEQKPITEIKTVPKPHEKGVINIPNTPVVETKVVKEPIKKQEVKLTKEELEKRKAEEELLNTIKTEPIIQKTTIEEEKIITKKAKMMKVTDIILIILIILLIAGFVIALALIN